MVKYACLENITCNIAAYTYYRNMYWHFSKESICSEKGLCFSKSVFFRTTFTSYNSILRNYMRLEVNEFNQRFTQYMKAKKSWTWKISYTEIAHPKADLSLIYCTDSSMCKMLRCISLPVNADLKNSHLSYVAIFSELLSCFLVISGMHYKSHEQSLHFLRTAELKNKISPNWFAAEYDLGLFKFRNYKYLY